MRVHNHGFPFPAVTQSGQGILAGVVTENNQCSFGRNCFGYRYALRGNVVGNSNAMNYDGDRLLPLLLRVACNFPIFSNK
jgi:hypothetical protein